MPIQGVIPPGGIAGFSQMTPASRLALFPPGRGNGGTRRRRKAKASGKRKMRASGKRRASGGRKMKFGSPAWQKKYRVGKFAKKK